MRALEDSGFVSSKISLDSIRAIFLDEVQQLLEEAESCLLALDSAGTSTESFQKLFRLVHNVKGGAKSVGFEALSRTAHRIEDVLSRLETGQITLSPAISSLLLRSIDVLKSLVSGLKADLGFTMDTSAIEAELEQVFHAQPMPDSLINELPEAKEQAQPSVTPAPTDATIATIKPALKAETKPPKPVLATSSSANARPQLQNDVLRVGMEKLDSLVNLVGELVVNQSIMAKHRTSGTVASDEAIQTLAYMDKIIAEVRDVSMSLRMIPVRQTFQRMNRIVRDVSSQLGKSVDFRSFGEDVELDKVVIERITDPLTHLIRNAVDHGIESPDARAKAGKPQAARVVLKAEQRDDRVLITVSDDGKGLDPDFLINRAISKGILKEGTKLSEQDAYNLIFRPGFSTKEQVSDISGRGVGMDVVRSMVEEMKGTVEIRTKLGLGTSFIITLPLSLSIISGMVIVVDSRKYVVPMSHLLETLEYQKYSVETLTGKGRMINLRGEVVPVLSLGRMLHGNTPPSSGGKRTRPGLITEYEGHKVSFEVDELLGQQQIVLKKLGREMQGLPGIIAGAILGNGEPGLILNLSEFVRRAHAA